MSHSQKGLQLVPNDISPRGQHHGQQLQHLQQGRSSSREACKQCWAITREGRELKEWLPFKC